jgi:protein TonB
MALRLLTFIASCLLHAGFTAALFLPKAGSEALHAGVANDVMVIERGLALEGFAKMGEDQMTLEEVEARPALAAAAQPLPEEVKPFEELSVVSSEIGPEQENVKAPDVGDVPEKEPEEKLEEPEEKVEEQPLPPQVASVQQESVVAMRESSGEELRGGDASAHSAYIGTLRTHLERSKINPRTNLVGTAIVRFSVNTAGELRDLEIASSSGKKQLDEAAIASVQKAAPFPPMPPGLQRDKIEVSVPFRFVVRR